MAVRWINRQTLIALRATRQAYQLASRILNPEMPIEPPPPPTPQYTERPQLDWIEKAPVPVVPVGWSFYIAMIILIILLSALILIISMLIKNS